MHGDCFGSVLTPKGKTRPPIIVRNGLICEPMESEPVIWVSQVATLCPDTPSPVAQKPPSGVILIPPSVLKRSRNSDTVKTLRSSQKMIRGTTDVPRTKSQMPVAKVTIKAQTKFPTRLVARYRFNGEASFKDFFASSATNQPRRNTGTARNRETLWPRNTRRSNLHHPRQY